MKNKEGNLSQMPHKSGKEEKLSQIDKYLEQLEKKEDNKSKKRIFLILGLLCLPLLGFLSMLLPLGDKPTPTNVSQKTNQQPPVAIADDSPTEISGDEADNPLAMLSEEDLAEMNPADDASEPETDAPATEEEEKKEEEAKPASESSPVETETKPAAEEAGTAANEAEAKPSEGSPENRTVRTPSTSRNPNEEEEFRPKGGQPLSPIAAPATPAVRTESLEVLPTNTDTPEEEASSSLTPSPKPEETQEKSPNLPVGKTTIPSFPGGEKKMKDYFSKKIRYPSKAIRDRVEGSVVVRVKVDGAGNIVNSEVVRGIGSGCDREVLKAISEMPKWEPGLTNGEPTPKFYMLSVGFKLPE